MFKSKSADPINPISRFTGEFLNKEREKLYFTEEIKNNIKYVRFTLLALGFLFAAFIIPDMLANSDSSIRIKLIFVRSIVFCIIVMSFFLLKKVSSCKEYVFLITLCETAAAVGFIHALVSYQTPNFLLQSFSAIMMTIAYFMIFNRFAAIITVTLLMQTGFIFAVNMFHAHVSITERAATLVYLFFTTLLSAITFLRTSKLKRKQAIILEQLEALSITDALTRCFNRMKFNDELRSEIDRSRRYDVHMSLILYDYDYFKTINDDYGHPAGDLVLIRTSRIVKQSIRSVDILARWGGEEFMILLPDTRLTQASDLAERIRNNIASCDCGPVKKVTCSFGVTELREDDTIETLLQRVDDLLYLAKQEGRNCVISG